MTAYARTTTSTAWRDLPEGLVSAISERAEAAGVTLTEGAPAFLTHSTKTGRPRFAGLGTGVDPDTEHLTAMVIGHRDLLVGTSGERRGTHVLTCRLTNAEIGAPLAGAEDGMFISGFARGGGEGGLSSYFIGLGAPAGDQARRALKEAIVAAKAA